MKKTVNEFKEFIAKGNVVSMAVGVVMGGRSDRSLPRSPTRS